jgi:hypothetical protein
MAELGQQKDMVYLWVLAVMLTLTSSNKGSDKQMTP